MLAHADRTRVISDEYRPAVITKNLRVKATFLVDGVVAGTWESKSSRREATLTLTPFGKLKKREADALKAEGEAMLRFTDPDVSAVAVVL
jgi:hypothetical protein